MINGCMVGMYGVWLDSIMCELYAYPGGGGGNSNIQMPGCVCPGFENEPILNDTFWCKTYP